MNKNDCYFIFEDRPYLIISNAVEVRTQTRFPAKTCQTDANYFQVESLVFTRGLPQNILSFIFSIPLSVQSLHLRIK